MKKKISIILLVVSVLLVISYLGEDSTRTYIYTSKNSSETPLYLYIDNQYIGELPHVEKDAAKDISLNKALDWSLKHGTHIVTAKDKRGNDISSLKIEVASLKTSSWGLIGGHSQAVRGLLKRRIVVDMF